MGLELKIAMRIIKREPARQPIGPWFELRRPSRARTEHAKSARANHLNARALARRLLLHIQLEILPTSLLCDQLQRDRMHLWRRLENRINQIGVAERR